MVCEVTMKFSELDSPDCSTCPAKKLSAYSATTDAAGEVKAVYCIACDRERTLAAWEEKPILRTRLMTDATIAKVRNQYGHGCDPRYLVIAKQVKDIHYIAKATFEPRVWFGGLQKAVRATRERGLKTVVDAEGGAVEMTTYCLAGRCMIQLDRGDTRLTLITAEDEDEPRMGIQGIDATRAEALAMLSVVTKAWVAAGGLTMEPAPNVGMG
jgi:hypothetical protein